MSGDYPAAMCGSVFDAGAEETIGRLKLDVVVERRVIHRRLRGRVGHKRQPSRLTDVAAPLN